MLNSAQGRTGKKPGFTLIELLVVIAIIATLAVVVFVALDPVRRFQESRNARRFSDVDSILTAVHSSIVDNGGVLPTGLVADATVHQLGTCSSGGATLCSTAVAACTDLTSGAQNLVKYLKAMPIDPSSGSTAATTGYSISVDANNIVTVNACRAERSVVISASR